MKLIFLLASQAIFLARYILIRELFFMMHSKNRESFLYARKNDALMQFTGLASRTGKSRFVPGQPKREKGQSFIELTLVVVFLMIFVAGIVEFGFMLNNYLNLVDASREAVRYSSNFDPFKSDGSLDVHFFEDTITLTRDVLAPVELDPTTGDDIVVSFFSVGGGVYERYPNDQGWAANSNQVSKLSNAEIQDRLDSSAPPTGVLLVEIFYHYPQLLKLPIFTAFVQDPMPVYVYAVMPLTAAEPLVTNVAGGGGGGGGGPTVTLAVGTSSPTILPATPTDTPVVTAIPTEIHLGTPTSSPTPTNTATATLTFTPTNTATASNTPSPTATSFVCNVSASSSFMVSRKLLVVDITNNTNQTLHYGNMTLFFNANSPAGQYLNRVRNGGTTLWTGNVSSSPASSSIGGEVAPMSTTQLQFRFNKNYQISGVEHLLLEFQENGCPLLDIQ